MHIRDILKRVSEYDRKHGQGIFLSYAKHSNVLREILSLRLPTWAQLGTEGYLDSAFRKVSLILNKLKSYLISIFQNWLSSKVPIDAGISFDTAISANLCGTTFSNDASQNSIQIRNSLHLMTAGNLIEDAVTSTYPVMVGCDLNVVLGMVEVRV